MAILKSYGNLHAAIIHRHNADIELCTRFIIVKKLASKLPSSSDKHRFAAEIPLEDLADPQYWTPGKIDELIGAGTWAKAILGEIKRDPNDSNGLVVQRTRLGWVVIGDYRHISGIRMAGTSYASLSNTDYYMNI